MQWAWGGGATRHDHIHEIEHLEQRWRSAELSGDAAAMDPMLADDYVGLTLQGKVNTKAQQLRRMRERRIVFERMDLSEIKIRISGDVAVVTGLARVLGRGAGLPLDGRYHFTQILRLGPGGAWTITNFEPERMPDRARPLLALQHAPHTG